jgi:hypothetical protein
VTAAAAIVLIVSGNDRENKKGDGPTDGRSHTDMQATYLPDSIHGQL